MRQPVVAMKSDFVRRNISLLEDDTFKEGMTNKVAKIILCSYFDIFPVRSADQDAVFSIIKGIDPGRRMVIQRKYENIAENVVAIGNGKTVEGFRKILSVLMFNLSLFLRIHRLTREEGKIIVISTKFHLTPSLIFISKLMNTRWISVFLDSFIAYKKSPYDKNPYSIPMPVLKAFEWLTYMFSDRVYLNSTYEINAVRSKVPKYADKIMRTPLHSGRILCTRGNKKSSERESFLAKLELPLDAMVVSFHGNFAENRQSREAALYVINVLSRTIDPSRDICFIIIGNGLNVPPRPAKNVRYLGYVDDLCTVLSYCDVEVAPLVGGSGIKMKILDALSVGLPVLTTEDGARGFVEPNPIIVSKLEDFPTKLLELLSSRDSLEKLRFESRRYAELYYSPNSEVEKVISELTKD